MTAESGFRIRELWLRAGLIEDGWSNWDIEDTIICHCTELILFMICWPITVSLEIQLLLALWFLWFSFLFHGLFDQWRLWLFCESARIKYRTFEKTIWNNKPTISRQGGLVVECSPPVRKVVGSIPGPVIPKTLKMVLNASLLGTQY